jgi:hypothetical protein
VVGWQNALKTLKSKQKVMETVKERGGDLYGTLDLIWIQDYSLKLIHYTQFHLIPITDSNDISLSCFH